MQRNLVLVNDLFKSKGNVADCITDSASAQTGSSTEQILHHNGTLILVCTVTGQFSKRNGDGKKPTRYSVNIALDDTLAMVITYCAKLNYPA